MEPRKMVERMGELQHAPNAEKKQALLVVLQGADGSAIAGAVSKALESMKPQLPALYETTK